MPGRTEAEAVRAFLQPFAERLQLLDGHDDEHQGLFRCSSRSYNYKMSARQGDDHWRMHWHPEGTSPVRGPHLHLPAGFDRHLPTGRLTFEHAIGWLAEYGAPLRYSLDETKARLAELEAPHLLYRTWTSSPDERRG